MKFWVRAKGDSFEEQLLVNAVNVEELKRSLELLLHVSIKHLSITDFQSQIVDKLSNGTSDIITVHVRTQEAAAPNAAGPQWSMPSWGGYNVFGDGGAVSTGTAQQSGSGNSDPMEQSAGEQSFRQLTRTASGGTLNHPGNSSTTTTSRDTTSSSSRRGSADLLSIPDVVSAIDRICVKRDDLVLLLNPAFRGRFHSVVQGCFVRVRGALSLGTTASGYATVQVASVVNESQVGLDLVHIVEVRMIDAISNSPPTPDEVRLWARHMIHAGRQLATPMFIETKRSALDEGLKQVKTLLGPQTSPAVTSVPLQDSLKKKDEDAPAPLNIDLDGGATSATSLPQQSQQPSVLHPSVSKLRRRQTMILQPNLFVPSSEAVVSTASSALSPIHSDTPPKPTATANTVAADNAPVSHGSSGTSPTSGPPSPFNVSRSSSRLAAIASPETEGPHVAQPTTLDSVSASVSTAVTAHDNPQTAAAAATANGTKASPSALKHKFDALHVTVAPTPAEDSRPPHRALQDELAQPEGSNFVPAPPKSMMVSTAASPQQQQPSSNPNPSDHASNTAIAIDDVDDAVTQSASVARAVPPHPIVKLNDAIENGWMVPVVREDNTIQYILFGTRHSNAKVKKARASDYSGFVVGLCGTPPQLNAESDRDVTMKGFVVHGVPQLFRGIFVTLASVATSNGIASHTDTLESPSHAANPDGAPSAASSNGYEFSVLSGRDIRSLYNPLFRCQLPVPMWGAPMSFEKAAQAPQLVSRGNRLHVFYLVTLRADFPAPPPSRDPTASKSDEGRRYGLAHAWTSDLRMGHWTLESTTSPILVTQTAHTALPFFHVSADVELPTGDSPSERSAHDSEAPASPLVMLWCELPQRGAVPHHARLQSGASPSRGLVTALTRGRRRSPSRGSEDDTCDAGPAPPTPPAVPPTSEFGGRGISGAAVLLSAAPPLADPVDDGVVRFLVNHDEEWRFAAWTPHAAPFSAMLLGDDVHDGDDDSQRYSTVLDEIRCSGTIRGVSLTTIQHETCLVVAGEDRHRRGVVILAPIEVA